MTITYHEDVVQGSPEWMECRRGLLTASEMKLIISIPKPETRTKKDGTPYKQREMEPADNEHCRAHLYELLSQRISGYVEPSYVGDDMLRGKEDELEAAILYAKHYNPLHNVGFVTNDEWGFTIGCSPDALVRKDGGVECKSRRQKYQVQTIVESYATDTAPDEFQIQIQTCLLVTRRLWWDFMSFSAGLPTAPIRVLPDERIQAAIIDAATAFEARLAEKMAIYHATVADRKMIPTERKIVQEMF